MRRTRATWLAYLLLGAYAYLQAAPGAIVPFLRAELALGYPAAALHLTLFAAGGLLAGATGPALERRVGRTRTVWLGAAGMSAAVLALAAGRSPAATLPAALAMGWIGTWVLVGVQAALADEHREAQAVALSESNVLASAGALSVPAAVATAEAAGLGWRAGLLVAVAAFAALGLAFRATRLADDGVVEAGPVGGGLPRRARAALVLVGAGAAAEWSVGFWAASFLQEEVGLPAAVAVAATTAFYAAMLAGRVMGSLLARRVGAPRLLAASLALAAAGFPLFWLAGDPVLAVAGLVVVGFGLGDAFPLSIALALKAAPGRAARVSARGVQAGALAVLSLPLGLGVLADRVALRPAFALVPVLLALSAAALWAATATAPAPPAPVGAAPAAGRRP